MERISVMNFVEPSVIMTMGSLFGEDAEKISEACINVMKNWLYPYKGCYQTKRPLLQEFLKNFAPMDKANIVIEYKEFIAKWYADNPDEAKKEEDSSKEWEKHRNEQFRIIYGIAKKHKMFLKWCGNNNPRYGDRWEIYMRHRRIGRICIN